MKKDINQLIKEVMEGHQMPYNPNAWNNIKGRIPSSGAGVSTWLIGALSTAALMGIFYLTYTTINSSNKVNQTSQITKKKTTSIDRKDVVILESSSDLPNELNNTQTQHSEKNVSSFDNTQNHSNTQSQKSNLAEETHLKQQGAVVENNSVIHSMDKVNHNTTQVPNNENPLRFIAPNVTCSAAQICVNDKVTFTAKNIQNGCEVWWMSSGAVIGKGEQLSISLSETSTIETMVIDNTGKKHNVASHTVRVNTVEKPTITVQAIKKNTKPYFVLSLNDANYEAVQWNFEYKNAEGSEFDFYLTKQGRYAVNVQVTNSIGCEKTFTQNVDLDENYNLFAENTFTPTQTINNTFIPKALLARDVNFKMKIMNRAGQVIYQTTDATQPWKGNMPNGEIALQGGYLWVVTLINEEGLPEKYAGELLLLR